MSNTRITIKEREAFLGEHDNCLFAFLIGGAPLELSTEPAEGGVRLVDARRDRVLCARQGERDQLCQLELLPRRQAEAQQRERSVWEAIRVDEEGRERQVRDIEESGIYSLRLAGTQRYLGRFRIEPLSLMPRPAFLLPEDHPRPYLLVLAQGAAQGAAQTARDEQAAAGQAG